MRAKLLVAVAILILGGLAAGIGPPNGEHAAPNTSTMDHDRWDAILREFVDRRGDVAYRRLQQHADTALRPYLDQLAAARPGLMSRGERLAFWINAYNAYTVKLILDHYPVTSIQDIAPPAPGETPFQRPVGTVADTIRTLDEIEHRIIRTRFAEPRIHFALVCAAKSCPRLRREAYRGPSLDRQLEQQTDRFLHTEKKNRVPAGDGVAALSPIFKWYGQDFGAEPGDVQRFAAGYFDGSVRDSLQAAAYEVRYLSYDWTLNDQRLEWGAYTPDDGS